MSGVFVLLCACLIAAAAVFTIRELVHLTTGTPNPETVSRRRILLELADIEQHRPSHVITEPTGETT